jgi:hypothetical protein
MNNLHFTNFQAAQDGTRRYRYRFAPADSVSAADVATFGRGLLEPLAARQYSGPLTPGATGLQVEPADAVLAEVRPAAGGVRVRLRNPGRSAVEATVSWAGAPHPVTVPVGGAADVLL